MKHPILRILTSAILFSLISSFIVAIIGFILKWKTSTEFSNALFWTGAIFFMISAVIALGRINQPASGLQTSQSAVCMDADERSKLWQADLFRGNNLMIFMGIVGLCLFGLSGLTLLVGRLF